MNRLIQSVGLLIVLLAWGFTTASRPDHQFHLWVLDVGQGDAILVQTPADHQILIDGGPDDSVLPALGSHMPFWDRTVEQVILSHNHADHLTGLVEVARRYTINSVWISGAVHTIPEYFAWLTILKNNHVPTKAVHAGEILDMDGVHIEVLHPLEDWTGKLPKNQHDATVVARLTYRGQSILLTGDIEENHEAAMIAAYCPNSPPCPKLQSQVLKVPHHGSRTGLLPAFLQAVNPKQAIISDGVDNPYGHPAPATLAKLKDAGVETFRTDTQGTIRVDFQNDHFVVSPE